MNTYSARTYLPALNPLARKYAAAKARPQRRANLSIPAASPLILTAYAPSAYRNITNPLSRKYRAAKARVKAGRGL